jgi:hypothetical protein
MSEPPVRPVRGRTTATCRQMHRRRSHPLSDRRRNAKWQQSGTANEGFSRDRRSSKIFAISASEADRKVDGPDHLSGSWRASAASLPAHEDPRRCALGSRSSDLAFGASLTSSTTAPRSGSRPIAEQAEGDARDRIGDPVPVLPPGLLPVALKAAPAAG